MNFAISLNQPVTDQDSLNLTQLAEILEHDYDVPVQLIRQDGARGVKDGGLTIAISIIGVGISAIGTIISALSYWKSQQPNYSISLKSGDRTITIDNVNQETLKQIVSSIEDGTSSTTEIVISEE